ncbi:sorbosone dehydrogenase family protein [Amycolatopsis sp. YIM 10]|uniref:PQQ-dependent sugar dehydrogenase n=1 Tax=Amycolatopsis sp. YIM 10 TaxID=2653857 RepID=UPI0012901D22|nr:PQQ-dependent sugar dehydrogenase [Amycolatopsis sp. YIM 10]
MPARKVGIAMIGALVALTSACTDAPPAPEAATPAPPPSNAAPAGKPGSKALKVEEVTGGLTHGWDIGFLPDGKALITQRPGKIALVSGLQPGATATEVKADFADLFVEHESGLLGLVVHPDFAQSRKFTTCQNYKQGETPTDVRLITWTLSADGTSAQRVQTLLTGMPVNPNGRHSGCRPTLAEDGALLVGTGDAADDPDVPQDRTNLGGKVLRIDLNTGEGLPDNPFASSANANERRVYTYGHRNVQGVAVRTGTGQVFVSEHGPTNFDELSLVKAGGNYGWDPSQGGTVDEYDESVPMTDLERFPDAVPQAWTSGKTTEAPSGATFLTGPQWGDLDGRMVLAALRGQKLLVFTMDAPGAVTDVYLPPEFNAEFGRLRGVRTGPDGALYVTTSTGTDDKLLRVTLA